MKTTIRQLGCALLILASGAALAAEPEQCRTVRLGTVNWTDVVASSAVAEARSLQCKSWSPQCASPPSRLRTLVARVGLARGRRPPRRKTINSRTRGDR